MIDQNPKALNSPSSKKRYLDSVKEGYSCSPPIYFLKKYLLSFQMVQNKVAENPISSYDSYLSLKKMPILYGAIHSVEVPTLKLNQPGDNKQK